MISIAKPSIDQREIDAVVEVMLAGQLAQGEKVFEFEQKFAAHFGYDYTAAISNGTAALHIALLAAGVKPGEKVLTSPFSFIATTNAIIYCGAIPIFVDVDEDSFNLSSEKLVTAVKEHPDAKYLLLVHLFGMPCEMNLIMNIAKEHNLVVVEDCAQAHGAKFENKPVGSFGIGGTFSFYPTKNMTTGEGGMITSSNENYIELCKKLINHGSTVRYIHEITGYNFRLTNLAAAIGLVQLTKVDNFNKKRKHHAKKYINNIDNPYIHLPKVDGHMEHSFHQFTLKTVFRDELITYLEYNNIGYGIYYPIPIHKQENVKLYMKSINWEIKCQPAAESLSKVVLSIPVHPQLTEEELIKIVDTLNNFKPR